MADDDITLDGKPLQSLRVADLKAALEQRNLPKTGQKNTLIKRLKGALMLENLQKSSNSHGTGLQPNSQMGEEMSQNSFIKQYLAKQQELLRQRLEREAQQEEEADESTNVEDQDHLEDNTAYVSEKHRLMPSQPLGRAEAGEPFSHGLMAFGPGVHGMESQEPPGAMLQRASFYQGLQEPPAPSPPRAVASLSVRVLGQPECQGLPPAVPRMQEKANTAPSESAHPMLHLSRSAGVVSAAVAREDSDDEDASDDDSDDDDDWGPTASRKSSKVTPQPHPPSVPPASGRSKRKLQPPQHIPPPQLHSPLQLRHPTPPPSPPPNLFPLPDTPKQSPPDADHRAGEGSKVASFPSAAMQRRDSDSSSRSSSPEPPAKRRPGPLSLLVHKMESEQALDEAQSTSAADMSGEETQTTARPEGAGEFYKSPPQTLVKKRQQENREEENNKKAEEEKVIFEKKKEIKRFVAQEKQQDEKVRNQEQKRHEELMAERQETSEQVKMSQSSAKVITGVQDSGSSSDSDSSSHSSSSSEEKNKTTRQLKTQKADHKQMKASAAQSCISVEKLHREHLTKSEVSEPSAAAITEEEPDSESSMALPAASGAEPENSDGPVEESTTPKAFAARKISLTSNKMSPASSERGGGEPEATNVGRKRRWGSSTAVTAKKPSISITTDSLKSLIPDIKVNPEAVVDLPAEELQYSGDEETMDSNHDDQDNGLKIQRTVTQVVPSDSQKNGQGNEADDGEKMDREKPHRISKDRRKSSVSEESTEPTISPKGEGEAKKVSPSDSLVRRSISQQKSGVSVTIDDPIRTNRQPSPPRGKVSNIIHITNLVRPFTLGQLKELLNQTGSMVEEGFWIDKIKSHCFVTYSTTEEAVSTRNALHGVKWPQSNPKVLSVDFCEQDELDFHKGIIKVKKELDHGAPVPGGPQNRLPPLMSDRDRDRDRDKERDRGIGSVRDLWAEREREMERRERARGEREWDRDKIREFARPGEDGRRSRSRERDRRRRERAKSKERKAEKKDKDEPPAKLLDDLFLKTKAAPCIYWLPLTEEQAAQKALDRTERQKERERIRKELDEEDKKREEEKRERLKAREKESGPVSGVARRVSEGDRERDRGRDGDRRRDSGQRPRRLSAGNPRPRSRTRSNPRDRRR